MEWSEETFGFDRYCVRNEISGHTNDKNLKRVEILKKNRKEDNGSCFNQCRSKGATAKERSDVSNPFKNWNECHFTKRKAKKELLTILKERQLRWKIQLRQFNEDPLNVPNNVDKSTASENIKTDTDVFINETVKSVAWREDPMLDFVQDEHKRQKTSLNTQHFTTFDNEPEAINRFGIEPGYQWDGVDRSMGFERRVLEKSIENNI